MSNRYSVVIPAYNAAATIAEAIESVLSQTVRPAQVIVVDDGSTDDTAVVVERLAGPICLIRQANAGPGAASTNGIRSVTTPLLAMLDSDDVWLPTKIERQLDFLKSHPEISAAFTLAQLFHGDSAEQRRSAVQRFWARSTMLIATATARTVGDVVDPPGGRGEMIDWLARCSELGFRLGMVEEILTLRRVRPGSLSYGRDAARDFGYLYVVKQALERKRQNARSAATEGACS